MDTRKVNEIVQKLIQEQVNLEMEKYTEIQERLDYVLDIIVNHLSDGRELMNFLKTQELNFNVLEVEGFIRACLSIIEDIGSFDSYLAEIIKNKREEIMELKK